MQGKPNARARARTHTHTHTILSLTFQGSTISTMSFQCHFILNLLFSKNLKKKLSAM